MGSKWKDSLNCSVDPDRDVVSRMDGLCVRPSASPRRRSKSPRPSPRQDSSPSSQIPQTLSPDRQIPNYSGHLPGVQAENIYGMSFRSASEQAYTDRCSPNIADTPDRASLDASQSPTSSRKDWAQIPGYTGHMPGVGSSNIHGSRYRAAIDKASREGDMLSDVDGSVRALFASTDPAVDSNRGDAQFHAGKNDRTNSVAEGMPVSPTTRSPRSNRSISPRPSRSLSQQRGVPPGYCGHVPMKDSGNVHGKTFGAANKEAANDSAHSVTDAWTGGLRCEPSQSPQRQRSPSPCAKIPGYRGYVPKKGPENIYGASFHVANERAAWCV